MHVSCRMPKQFFIFIFTVFLILFTIRDVSAQVCNCSSAPLIESRRFEPLQSGELRLGTSHEYHELLVQPNSDPTTPTPLLQAYLHRTLLEFQYALNRNWSILGSLPFIMAHIEPYEFQNHRGNRFSSDFGTFSIFISNQLMNIEAPLSFKWAIGPGIHLPTGPSTISFADEPTNTWNTFHTGSWAYSIWTQISSSFDLILPWKLFLNGSYRMNRTGQISGIRGSYKIGNSFLLTGGSKTRLSNRFSYTGILQFRSESDDQWNRDRQESTSGTILQSISRFTYAPNSRIMTNIDLKLPLLGKQNEVQIKDKYMISASLYLTI